MLPRRSSRFLALVLVALATLSFIRLVQIAPHKQSLQVEDESRFNELRNETSTVTQVKGFSESASSHTTFAPSPAIDHFKNCDRCLAYPEWCEKFGSRNIDLSIAHEGSGDRLRRVLAKSAKGQPIRYGIIGGSLSRGHGCHCTTFHRQIFDWWNETYPHLDNYYSDGSVGARGTNYFKFCHAEHLEPDLDIVIIELSINDHLDLQNIRNMESIVRSILTYPSSPAIIMVASFSLMDKIETGVDGHLAVAEYYDIPVISMRNSLLPIINKFPEMRKVYFAWENPGKDFPDVLHFSNLGHEVLAKTTVAFIKRQVCILKYGRPTMLGNPELFPIDESYSTDIPRQRLSDVYQHDPSVKGSVDQPQCMSIDSPRHKLTPLYLEGDDGWEPWSAPHTGKAYFRTTEPGKRISFEVNLTSGQVGIYYLRSRSMGLGWVKCWFNDDKQNARNMDGWWNQPENVGDFTLVNEVTTMAPGKYIVHCETQPKKPDGEEGRGTTFLIIGVMTI